MIDPNAPAFPTTHQGTQSYTDDGGYARTRPILEHKGGISIRAELAARAMQGILSSPFQPSTWRAIAEQSVSCADALLAELNREAKDQGGQQ